MMKLALRLGRSLGELQQTIGMSELRLWAAYDRISPIGDERGDFQAAQITAAAYNAQGGRNQLSIEDVLLGWGESENKIDDDGSELEAFLGQLAE
ncbi:phage tail assembly protein T [Yersinia kristensenii]|uniref:phage tail assembly protein T n=1 Tax=Yersinia kristensenii TaxID=28152 RepID=UPI0039C0B95F